MSHFLDQYQYPKALIESFDKFYNISNLSLEELDNLAGKLESALWKVSPSNYKGIYYCDAGTFLMGVKNHDSFIEEIKEEEEDVLPISILYNKKSWKYEEEISSIIIQNVNTDHSFHEIEKKYGSFQRFIINNKCYPQLVSYIRKQNDRLSFQVLGAVLMVNGARITNELKEQILENSRWEDEQHLYKDKKIRELRKKYLRDFRENIKNYKEGNPVDFDIYREK